MDGDDDSARGRILYFNISAPSDVEIQDLNPGTRVSQRCMKKGLRGVRPRSPDISAEEEVWLICRLQNEYRSESCMRRSLRADVGEHLYLRALAAAVYAFKRYEDSRHAAQVPPDRAHAKAEANHEE